MRAATVAFALLLLLGGISRADSKTVARDAYREGTRRYDLGEFQNALEAFKRAYVAYEDPAFLYNIAQCHRQLGEKAEAVRFYKTFLRKVPAAPNREEIEKLIFTLESSEPPKPAPAPVVIPPPAPTPAPAPPAPAPIVLAPVTPAPAAASPPGRTMRIAGLSLIGAGGAFLVLGGAFVGLAASANDDVNHPASGVYDPAAQDRRNTYQSLDVAFFVAGGVVAATGVTLFLLGRRTSKRLGYAPAVRF